MLKQKQTRVIWGCDIRAGMATVSRLAGDLPAIRLTVAMPVPRRQGGTATSWPYPASGLVKCHGPTPIVGLSGGRQLGVGLPWSRLALESSSGTRLLWRSPAGTRPLWRSPAGTRLKGRGLPRCLERSRVPGQPTHGPLLRHFYCQVLVHNKSIKQTYIYVLWSLHCLAKSK